MSMSAVDLLDIKAGDVYYDPYDNGIALCIESKDGETILAILDDRSKDFVRITDEMDARFVDNVNTVIDECIKIDLVDVVREYLIRTNPEYFI